MKGAGMKPLKCTIGNTVLILSIIAGIVFAAGCAKPPVEEMNNATEAVTRAENDSDAVTYASNSIARARESLARMHGEAACKRYDAARSYAAEAIAIAERAIIEGRSGAEHARIEAAGMVFDLKPLIAETEQGIRSARAAGLPLDFNTLSRDFDAAQSAAKQAETAINGKRYDDAIKLAKSARSDLISINQRLSSAVITKSRKK